MSKPSTRRASCLASQQIDERGPGTILADFEVLLDFLKDGVRASKKHHLLPMARLFELDERMSRPLRPRLKRPFQKSFPHINGLYLLLRATWLAGPAGQGKTGVQLVLDPAMLAQWRQLNATERYFNLLEAWWRRASFSVSGLPGRRWEHDAGSYARDLWLGIERSDAGILVPDRRGYFLSTAEGACTLALYELFGLLDVERREPEEGESWHLVAIRRKPFGDDLMALLQQETEWYVSDHSGVDFGAWQDFLQPYFPEWVNNLQLPEPEFRDGVFYFKVSLGKPWRRIAIPAESDMDELADCIISAFEFDGDHLYEFQFTERDGQKVTVGHPYVDGASVSSDEIQVGYVPLRHGESMLFQYDFGADWRFDVKLEKIDTEDYDTSEATIIESHGEAPPEYDFDEDW